MNETLEFIGLLIESLPQREQEKICDQLRGFVQGWVMSKPDGEKLIGDIWNKQKGKE